MSPLDIPLSALVKRPFDCPSNLKEAIDWMLRVTGKDGGQGGDKSQDLARAITELDGFKDAINAAVVKLKESGDDVPQALQKLQVEGTLKNIIDQLTNGLRAFIGYGKGQGIALVIDPLQQLRDGLLWFLNQFVDNLRRINVDTKGVTGDLRGAVSKGKGKFDEAVRKLSQITDNSGKISKVMTALKNVDGLKSKETSVGEFASEVKTYLGGVLDAVKAEAGNADSQVQDLCSQLQTLMDKVGDSHEIIKQVEVVKNASDTLYKKKSSASHTAQPLIEGVTRGTDNMLIPLQKKNGYKSSYQPNLNWSGTTDNNTVVRIFLGCVPIYYYWLTYLYWKCKQPYTDGGWASENLSRAAFRNFIVGMGYNSTLLNTRTNGSNVVTAFSNLQGDFTSVTQHKSHTEFFASLDPWSKSVSDANTHPLTTLFLGASIYFTSQQSKRDATSSKSPSTIREMLYWLSGLQFSPNYNSIEIQIETHIPKTGLHVADSSVTATTTSTSGDTLTQSQMKGFLLSSCLSAPGVLGAIQGNTADSKEPDGEPWLHSLFCNSMNLQYPSGSALFNTLANYAYALQFQLHFLYRQCLGTYSYTCGWNQCAFGKNVNARIQGSNVVSYICATKCNKGGTHSHATRPDLCEHNGCGTSSNKPSPLQAFLTDNLKGFCRQQPGTSNHLAECSLGSMCHVPMGFRSKQLKSSGLGEHIFYPLLVFCSSPSTPLRQLCEKLSCLTKRTPRTLGDVFGFLWHLNGQLFGTKKPNMSTLADKLIKSLKAPQPSQRFPSFFVKILEDRVRSASPPLSTPASPTATVLSRSLQAMAQSIPFLYTLFMAKDSESLPVVLFDLNQQCHKVEVRPGSPGRSGTVVVTHNGSTLHQCSSSPADLFSLQTSRCTAGPNCGPYLSPLTHTNSSAFAPMHASAYLSWVLYLVDDLETELRGLRDAFESTTCANGGVTHVSGCNCPSIVECSGMLPLLYANGFTFANAYSLKNPQTKRSCRQFHDQLSAVLAQSENAPLFKLLTTIDDFLYMFRMYFFYNLSSIWIIYVCIVLYIYFLRADLLHLKSHVRFPSSHGIPPITLLTTGKPTVLTKVTKLSYFIP
ncbi:variant erythrocyte surface antigen-1 family protein [Babesia caballi]|uniref:Variant erythrocyte surface antigen-1 family protein n=1 Tax=Babesia caballi TaxID=5871 RepID=A0AAV4LPL2_BABCB|nr:variant erythrocyte surface antigen-1 family protein [Babesia caballi]